MGAFLDPLTISPMNEQNKTNKGPVFRRNIGRVKAAVFEQQTNEGPVYYQTRISSSYQDRATGEWKETSSFAFDELANLARLASLCGDFILSKQREGSNS